MIESRNNQVEISDVDPDVMHEMFLFLYTGKVGKFCEQIVMQLYTIADKYDISALKNVCSSFLKSSITVENVCKILQLAHMHCDDDLYQRALEFFSNHLQEIYSTDEWKEMENKNICGKLLQNVIAHNKPTK
ncbi:speckle-type POZ protein B-like [Stegodyphus dumicola]|uniref:speckle-type POZ protein B-like n=1 Tax=Stegodyphus dumicola TaxID=202533 RepID=UPI0015AF897A|nr:speckle-type POZ protein B-like [Stegodyphus dumicola]